MENAVPPEFAFDGKNAKIHSQKAITEQPLRATQKVSSPAPLTDYLGDSRGELAPSVRSLNTDFPLLLPIKAFYGVYYNTKDTQSQEKIIFFQKI